MRLRGFSLMTNILSDYAGDLEIIKVVSTVFTLCGSSVHPDELVG